VETGTRPVSEISQAHKNKYPVFSVICGIWSGGGEAWKYKRLLGMRSGMGMGEWEGGYEGVNKQGEYDPSISYTCMQMSLTLHSQNLHTQRPIRSVIARPEGFKEIEEGAAQGFS
jgi:hypothetical protein